MELANGKYNATGFTLSIMPSRESDGIWSLCPMQTEVRDCIVEILDGDSNAQRVLVDGHDFACRYEQMNCDCKRNAEPLRVYDDSAHPGKYLVIAEFECVDETHQHDDFVVHLTVNGLSLN